MPIIANTADERDQWLDNRLTPLIKDLYSQTEIAFVGIGEVQVNWVLVQNGFLSPEEAKALAEQGAVGEILGWAMDRQGAPINEGWSERVTSLPLPMVGRAPYHRVRRRGAQNTCEPGCTTRAMDFRPDYRSAGSATAGNALNDETSGCW